MFLVIVQISICFKISYNKKCEACDDLSLQIKVLEIFRLHQKSILQRFFSFCISLISTYCLFEEKKLVTIEIFLLNFFWGVKMHDKMEISAYTFE